MDVVELCSDLIKRQSVTPHDDGIIDYMNAVLQNLGFRTEMLVFSSADGTNTIKNLYARYGSGEKTLGFLGHLDVVPAGEGWDAFNASVQDGYLIGRGACDMKGGVAAFCCAVERYIAANPGCSIAFFLTGDEEVGSFEGTQSLLLWAKSKGVLPTDCIIGEPSSYETVGDRAYAGHRGSMNITVTSHGVQGHSAYSSDNSLTRLCKYIARMSEYNWNYNDKRYPKTKIEPTLLFTNNYATNVVPELSSANINVRFGGDYSAPELCNVFRDEASYDSKLELSFSISGEAYYCDSYLQDILSDAVSAVTGLTPRMSAEGGISDGRYMIQHCNIIEFGLSDATIHQKNEKVQIADLYTLEKIYLEFLNRYFA